MARLELLLLVFVFCLLRLVIEPSSVISIQITTTNGTTCGSCVNSLLEFLEEVQQDIVYANKTIDTNRIYAKLNRRLNELETALDEHSIGLKNSDEMLIRSMDFFAQNFGNKSIISSESITNTVDKLEQEARKIETIVAQQSNLPKEVEKDLNNVKTNILSLSNQFQHQLKLIETTNYELQLIYQNYHPIESSTGKSQTNDLIEYDARQFRSLIRHSEETLGAQVVDGDAIKQIYKEIVFQLEHINELAEKSRYLSRLQGTQIVANYLLNVSEISETIENDKRFEDKLGNHFLDWQTTIISAREIYSQLIELRQLVDSGAEREADERLLINELSRDVKTVQTRLDKLASKFNSSAILLTELKIELEQIKPIEFNLINLKNLTLELSSKTANITKWSTGELQVKEKELIDHSSWLQQEYKNRTAKLQNWTDFISITKSIKEILDNLNQINDAANNVNKTLNSDSILFVNNERNLSKESYLTVLNSTKRVPLSDINRRVANLKHLISLSSLELEQSKLQVNQVDESLDALMNDSYSNQNDSEQVVKIERLNKLIELSGQISGEINDFAGQKTNNLLDEFTKRLYELFKTTNSTTAGQASNKYEHYQEFHPSGGIDGAHDVVDGEILTYLTLHNETATSTNFKLSSLAFTSENFDRLNKRLRDELDLSKVTNLTRMASVSMRQSIDGLRHKIDYARSILSQIKLGRQFSNNHFANELMATTGNSTDSIDKNNQTSANAVCSDGIGDGMNQHHRGQCIKLKNPTDLGECCSTYTSISFLLELSGEGNQVDGVILFIGTPSSDLHQDSFGSFESQQVPLKAEAATGAQDDSMTAFWNWQQAHEFLDKNGQIKVGIKKNLDTAKHSRESDASTKGTLLRSMSLVNGSSPASIVAKGDEGLDFNPLNGMQSLPFLNLNSSNRLSAVSLPLISRHRQASQQSSVNVSHRLLELSPNDGDENGLASRSKFKTNSTSMKISAASSSSSSLSSSASSPSWEPNNRYAEYLAVELRQRRLAVVLCLGSQMVEEALDGVQLSSGLLYRVRIVRVGTLLSISVRSSQSSGSFTRSLASPHTVLNLDAHRSEIFVGGLPMPPGCRHYLSPAIGDISNNSENIAADKGSQAHLHHLLATKQRENTAQERADSKNSTPATGTTGISRPDGKRLDNDADDNQQQDDKEPNKKVEWCWPRGLQSRSGFSGQVDGLSLNGHKLGLWNTAAPPQYDYIATSRRRSAASQMVANDELDSSVVFEKPIDLLARQQKGQLVASHLHHACAPPINHHGQILNFLDDDEIDGHEPLVRMVSFSRPKSNISSSFVQVLNSNNELDDIMLENLEDEQILLDSTGSLDQANGHIRRLTLRFRTQQANGLLLHHTRPDHSSFMSVYISGGRPMMALDFDKKVRIESHIMLNDGHWHSLHLVVSRQLYQRSRSTRLADVHNSQPPTEPQVIGANLDHQTGQRQIKHLIHLVLDDKYLYKDRFSVLVEPVNLNQANRAAKRRRRQQSDRPPVVVGYGSDQRQHKIAYNNQLDHTELVDANKGVGSLTSQHQPAAALSTTTYATGTKMAQRSNYQPSESNNFEQLRKVLYFGGVEDKYIPLLRNQQIPTNFHGCLADVTINDIGLSFVQTNKNQGVSLGQCQID